MSTDLTTQPEVAPRKSSQDRILELVQQAHPGYHPVVAMATLAFASEDEAIQLNCHKEIAKYTVAVDRFVEVKSETKQTKRVVVELFGGPDQRLTQPAQIVDATDVTDKLAVHGQMDTLEQKTTVTVSGPAAHEEEAEPDRTRALLGVWGDGSTVSAASRFG